MKSLLRKKQQLLLTEFKRAGIILLGQAIRQKYSLKSPIYLDLREKLYQRPDLLWKTGAEFSRIIRSLGRKTARQVVIGVPDTATPLAVSTVLYGWRNGQTPSLDYLLLRKKGKIYGKGAPSYVIGSGEGRGREFNLIDDVMASGLSKWRSIRRLEKEGIRVNRIVVLLDRQQGGTELLEKEGYPVHSVFRLLEVVDFYFQQGQLSRSDHLKIQDFIATRRFDKALWETPQQPFSPSSPT